MKSYNYPEYVGMAEKGHIMKGFKFLTEEENKEIEPFRMELWKKLRIQMKEARLNNLKEKYSKQLQEAKETGNKVKISSWVIDASVNQKDEEGKGMIEYIKYAMPDGTIKIEEYPTY